MDTELLASLAGVLLSLLFAYVPGATEWFEKLSPTGKRQVMLGLLVAAAVVTFANQCQGDVACYSNNWQGVVSALFTAAVANQTTYLLVSRNSARAKAAAKK